MFTSADRSFFFLNLSSFIPLRFPSPLGSKTYKTLTRNTSPHRATNSDVCCTVQRTSYFNCTTQLCTAGELPIFCGSVGSQSHEGRVVELICTTHGSTMTYSDYVH